MSDDDKAKAEKEAADKAAAEAAAAKEAAEKAAAEDDDFDKERALATIRKLREAEKEGKADKKRAADLEARLAELEAKDLSDKEKLEKRNADLEAKAADAEQKLRTANLLAALSKPEHGIVNAAAAAKLIEGVDYGDDGAPVNLDAILPDFLEQNSFLKGEPVKKPAPDIDPAKGTQEGKPPALTADELAAAQATGKTPEQYAAYKKPPGEAFSLADYEKAQAALKPASQ